jgi:hypothetical protein
MHSYNAGLKLCNRNIWNILNGYGYVHMRRNNIFADINWYMNPDELNG